MSTFNWSHRLAQRRDKKGQRRRVLPRGLHYRERCFCQRMSLLSILYSLFLTLFISRSIVFLLSYPIVSCQTSCTHYQNTVHTRLLILRVCPLPLCAVTSPTSTPPTLHNAAPRAAGRTTSEHAQRGGCGAREGGGTTLG